MTVKLPDGQELDLGSIAALPGLIVVGKVEVYRVEAGGVSGVVACKDLACDPDDDAVDRLAGGLAAAVKQELRSN